LQTLTNSLHATGSFYEGDDYVSHIQNPNVPTSVVNQHGPTGYDYFNLYNNYDIGALNNLTMGLFTPIKVAVVPADGSGGQVAEGDNVYIDPLNTGVKQAELGSTLTFTPQPESGWFLKSFEATTSPALSNAEMAAAWTHTDGGVYSLVVPASDTTLTATFHQKAVLSVPAVTFPTNYSANGYVQPTAKAVTLKNTTPAGEYAEAATSVSGTLVEGDNLLFTLEKPTSVVAAGATVTTWTVRPVATGFDTARTYSTVLLLTYNNGAEAVTLRIPVSMVIANAGDLYLPDSDSGGAYDFGTVVGSGGTYSPAVSAKPVTVTSVGGDIAATDTVVSLANQRQNGSVAGEWFTLSGGDLGTIASGASNATAAVVPNGSLAAGDYTADLVVTYKVNGNTQTKTATGAVHFKVVTPAALTIGANLDFGAKDVGYAQNSLSYQAVALANSGGTGAQATKIELTGDNANSFRIAGTATGDGTTVVATVPASGSNATAWSVIPKADLPAGVHRAQVQVTYRTGMGDATATATADVTFKVVGPPHVVTQPASAADFDGAAVTLPEDARTDDDDTVGLTYQWYSNSANSNTGGTLISGATAASYSPPTNSAADTGYYYVVVTNSAGSVVSNAVQVKVTDRTWTGSVTPTSRNCPNAKYGYAAIDEQRFTFTNTGNQTITDLVGKLAGPNAAQGWFEVTYATGVGLDPGNTVNFNSVAPGAAPYVTIRPVTGLPVGDYSVDFEFSYAAGAGVQTATLNFTVDQAIPVVTWPTASSLDYGQALSASSLTGGSDTGGGTFAWQVDTIVPTVVNSGYPVVLTPADPVNYDYSGIALAHATSVTVAKRQLTGAWSASSRDYDGTTDAAVLFTPDNVLSGDIGVYVSGTGSFDTPTVGWNKPVTVTGIGVNNPNYAAPAAPTSLTADVTKATLANPPDLTLDAVESTATTYPVDLAAQLPSPAAPQVLGAVGYTIGSPSDPGGIVSGTQLSLGTDAASDDKLLVSVNSFAADMAPIPAVIPVTMHFTNFADVTFAVTVEITAKTPVTISGVSISDKTYDGVAAGYTGTLVATPAAALGTITAVYTGRNSTTYGPSAAPPVGAGDYTLTLGVPSDNLTYKGSVSWNFTIAKRTVNATIHDVALNYGDPLPVLGAGDVTYSGFTGSDTADTALQTQAIPSMPVTDTLTPGTWPIGFGSVAVLNSDAAQNYKLAHVQGKLTITAVPPYAPAGFTATAGDGEVTLTWVTPDNGGEPITAYELQVDDGGWTAIPGADAGTVTYTVTGLQNGQTYAFQIRAINAAGTGAASLSASATPKSNNATLVSVGGTYTSTLATNGTLANPEVVTLQVANTTLSLSNSALVAATGGSAALYTDAGFTVAGTVALSDVAPTQYHAYVIVTAQNGRKAYYDVVVTRARSSVVSLLQVAKVTPTITGSSGFGATGNLSVENGIFEIKTADLLAGSGGTAVLYDATYGNVLDRVPLTVTVSDATRTDLYVKVTAQDGTTYKNYHLLVTRQPLTDTTLFYVGGAAVSFSASAGQGTQASPTLGTVNVPHNVDTLSALAGGNIVPSDSATAAIVTSDWKTALTSQELASGATTYVYVIVTAQDLSTKQYYKIAAQREGSNDTALFSVATVALTFDEGNPIKGTAKVPWDVTYVTAASFEVAPGATASLSAGGRKTLIVGDNTVWVQVTAEDGLTQTTYELNVYRKSKNRDIAAIFGHDLDLSAEGSSPTDPVRARIEVDWRTEMVVPADVELEDPNSRVLLFPPSYFNDVHGDMYENLHNGETQVNFRTTAEDSTYGGWYTITFVKRAPDGAELLELYDTPVTVTSGDGTAGSPYLVDFTVPTATDRLASTDVRLSEYASTAVDAALAPGAYTTVELTVTAAAGNTNNYRIVVWRHADVAALTELVATVEQLLASGLDQAYTSASVLAVTDAIAAAKLVLADPDPAQTAVDAAQVALVGAVSKLEVPDDAAGSDGAAELAALVATVKQLSQAAYTADSWAKLVAKRDAANQVLADATHTAAQVQTAHTELLAAMLGLKLHYAKEARVQVAKVNVAKGKAFHLAGLAYLTSGKTEGLTFKSSNPKIARVSPSGKVVGVKTGKVTITATSKTAGADGKKLVVKVPVKVVKSSHKVKRVTASFSKTLNVGAVTQLRPVVASRYATPGKVTFKSSNPKIAKIDKTGKLTALKPGTVKITITAGSKKKTYTVTVK
jgi:hypothetical protein